MADKLKLIKGGTPKAALVYGMRLFEAEDVAEVEDAQVRLAKGGASRVTMHLIEGTRSQIKRQLMQSVDAFFELLDEG